MNPQLALGYKSASQMARRVTEFWATENLYCSSCDSARIDPTPANSQAVDFRCAKCSATYQLKAGTRWGINSVPDGAYEAMMRALQSDQVPNLVVMQYSSDWRVHNLLLVPSFFFSVASIKKRNPLGPNARRAGWTGCNILLNKIANEGKISLITSGNSHSPEEVRRNYDRVRPFADIKSTVRGWTLDVLRIVQRIGAPEFTLADIYRFEDELIRIYPSNRNIRPKIRQQLQILRDLGFIEFLGQGRYYYL